MQSIFKKLLLFGVAISVMTLAFSQAVSAHVVVRPAEVLTAGFQTFTVGVPNEKDIPTVSVKLVMPAGLQFISPTQKAGWKIKVEKEGKGESAAVKSITWSGSTIGEGFRDDFTFSAKAPEKAGELQWKAYQTYADGTVVSWDKASESDDSEGGNSGPFSVTRVVTETSHAQAISDAKQAAADAKDAANRSLYIAVAGLVVSLIGIFLATRKK